MPSYGPLLPLSASNVGTGVSWTDPSNISSNDDVYARIDLNQSETSKWLYGYNFAFSAARHQHIDGIRLVVDIANETFGGDSLYAGLTFDGVNLSGNWKSVDPVVGSPSAGGATDLWEASPKGYNIATTSFGIFIRAVQVGGIDPVYLEIDHINVEVSYRPTSKIDDPAFDYFPKLKLRY